MTKLYEYRIAYHWEQLPINKDGTPHRYAEKEQIEFSELLTKGWEPISGWGHPGGSAWRSHVILRRKGNE